MSFAYLPLYTGDYLRDTQHLSCSEHGIYLKLLMHCWDQRGPAPLDERKLCGIVNSRSTDEIEAMRRVLAEFFVRMGDGWYQDRMQREIERCQNISGARSIAGKMGYQAKAKQLLSKSRTLAKQVPLSPSPSPSLSLNQTPSGDATADQHAEQTQATPRQRGASAGHECPPGFEALWAEYPRKVSKADAAKAFARLKPDDALQQRLLAGVRRDRESPQWQRDGGQFVPHLATWLHGRRWEDESTATGGGQAVSNGRHYVEL